MKRHLTCFIAVILLLTFTTILFGCNDDKNATPANETPKDEWWNDEFSGTEITPAGLTDMLGGFAKGVCHPNENYDQIKAANIEWVRFDITCMPYDSEGNLTEAYKSVKARAKGYADRGIKVMAITPYPAKYIAAGLDPRDEANWPEIMRIARFFVEDLQGIVSAFQITNEMGIEHFTLPLTLEEAADFMGIQLKAMYRHRGDIAIGYNLAGLMYVSLNKLMEPYYQYVDYVGVDIYLGCFDSVFKSISAYTSLIQSAHKQTGKPIMVNEFGYIGAGQHKSDEEKLELLYNYGARGDDLAEAEAYARAHMKEFIESEDFPPKFRTHLELVAEIDSENMTQAELDAAYANMGRKLFESELLSHLYCQLAGDYQLTDYEHTQQGQADFFTDLFVDLKKIDYLCGAFVYCYTDSDACYVCGQSDCPVETGWGLVDGEGQPKPSYYAVRDAFAEIE